MKAIPGTHGAFLHPLLPPDAALELDGERVAVSAGQAVLIRPGVRHRAATPMKILNVVVPPFDPADEWFD